MQRSPWGHIYENKKILKGISWCSTAGHGGYRISKKITEQMSEFYNCHEFDDYLPNLKYGSYYWFEEDCDWALVELFIHKRYPEIIEQYSIKTTVEYCMSIIKVYNWQIFEKFFGVTIEPGQSWSKDRDMKIRT